MAFPSILGRTGATSAAADAPSFTLPFDVAWDTNLAGDRIIAFVAFDGGVTVSTASTGWTLIGQQLIGVTSGGAVFEYIVAADNSAIPDLVVDFSAVQQASAIAYWLRSATGALSSLTVTVASGSSADSNPPAITSSGGASCDVLVIASRMGDSTPAPTAPPAGYASHRAQAASGTGGAATDTAEKQVTLASAASEDPGVWTVATEQWVSWTVGYYENSGGGGTMGHLKQWDGSAWVLKPVKAWNGSAWATTPVKFWDGSAWIAS